jgi:hypothetical protein
MAGRSDLSTRTGQALDRLSRAASLGPPPLIEGEDGAAYNQLFAGIVVAVKPKDFRTVRQLSKPEARFDARRDARLRRGRKPLPLRHAARTAKRYRCAPRRPSPSKVGRWGTVNPVPAWLGTQSTFARSLSAREHPPPPRRACNPWTHPHWARGF